MATPTTPRTRRPGGTGHLYARTDAAGRESWYATWYEHGRKIKRRIGPKDGEDGLSKRLAERELRRVMAESAARPQPAERLTLEQVGQRLIERLRGAGRKPATLEGYESVLRIHLVPFFGDAALDRITVNGIERFLATKRAEGRAPKTIRNMLAFLNSIYAYADRHGLVATNPVRLVDKPRTQGRAEVRFLDEAELEALLRCVPRDDLGGVEGPLYVTAAMTGLRMGELLGLRWEDIDWTARRVRVRQAFVRGEFTTPKSARGSRSVPLAARVSAELDALSRRTAYAADHDLVFGHPLLGTPLDRSKVLKRFKAALLAAGVREVRFHDLRHTFGTRMAAAGVPMRTLQEWLGHRDFATTLIYADYQPSAREADLVDDAFRGAQLAVALTAHTEVAR
jgi:integrase